MVARTMCGLSTDVRINEGTQEMAPSSYGWIIDHDVVSPKDEENEAGVMGPHNISDAMTAELKAGEGKLWVIKDDDDIVYYIGRVILPPDDDEPWDETPEFGPLWDYGTPNAGATSIHYWNEETQQLDEL